MTLDELQTIYLKVRNVIRSCQTMPQWESARKYTQLFINQVPPARTRQFGKHLTEVLSRKKKIIQFNRGVWRDGR